MPMHLRKAFARSDCNGVAAWLDDGRWQVDRRWDIDDGTELDLTLLMEASGYGHVSLVDVPALYVPDEVKYARLDIGNPASILSE